MFRVNGRSFGWGTGVLSVISALVLIGCGGDGSGSAKPSMAGGVPAQPTPPVQATGAQMAPGAPGMTIAPGAPGAPGAPMGGMMAGGAMSAGGAAPAGGAVPVPAGR